MDKKHGQKKTIFFNGKEVGKREAFEIIKGNMRIYSKHYQKGNINIALRVYSEYLAIGGKKHIEQLDFMLEEAKKTERITFQLELGEVGKRIADTGLNVKKDLDHNLVVRYWELHKVLYGTEAPAS